MKIALIEDRIYRKEQYSKSQLEDFTILETITNRNFDILSSELCQQESKSLEKYDCILSHRSAFNIEQRDIIKRHCKSFKKPLVLFSGGISSNIYNDFDFPFLHINAKDFYSKNLVLFLNEAKVNNHINLLILQFGENWKLSLLLSLRNKINYRSQTGTLKWISDLEINELIKEELISNFNLSWLSENEFTPISDIQIQDFKNKLNELIADSI